MAKIVSACVVVGVLVAGVVAHGATGWRPAAGPLMTRWAKDVSPERVRPEYPRPQMVRENWINLNGLWQYAVRPKADPQPGQWEGQILVPFAIESALSGVMRPLRSDQRLWYRRTFQALVLSDAPRTLLHFGAADWQCTAWLNGKLVGQHSGGYDPFTFDVSDAVESGENELIVSVWDPTDEGYQPHGKQALKPEQVMYTAVSGIWQTVWIESVPAVYIRSLTILPDLDHGLLTATAHVFGDAEVTVTAKEGNKVIAQANGQAGSPVALRMQNPRPWSPETPYLYDLEVTLTSDGKAIDFVTSYFAMRKIEVRKDNQGIPRIMLNNQVRFLFGVTDQGMWPDGLYTAPTDEALKYDVVMAKTFGMNMARKHVKVEPARWYYWCDRLGLVVWQDMPSGDSGRNDASRTNFRRELKAMIDDLRNYPCIAMWVLFHLDWGQHDGPAIAQWVRGYDPTRPVDEASGGINEGAGQVVDMHIYPGPAMYPVEDTRASVLGEFGGLHRLVADHTWKGGKGWRFVQFPEFKTSTDLTDAYVRLLTQLQPLMATGLSAAVYTQLSDVEIEVHGLMTYDRALVKMDLDRMTEAARKLCPPPLSVKP